MLTYTTCVQCQEPLQVTYVGQESHPSCPQTAAELLAREFVDAIIREDQAEAERLEKQMNQAKSVSLGASALWYAKRGWPVFPLAPNTKQPATKNGFKNATTDLDQVRKWWTKNAWYNIGLPTGIKFDVIDIDGPEGIESLRTLEEGVIPEIHGKVSTPRGFHLYVLPTGHGNRAGVATGIDYRGEGGYVVGAPSRLDFKNYSWVTRPSPSILDAA